jgi:hypothetical protein
VSADEQWRRPTVYGPPGESEPPAVAPVAPQSPPYAGPPPTSAPPDGWRPPTVVQPAEPRTLPAQDVPGIEANEQQARTITYGVGLVAAAVLLVVLFVLCGRALL